MRCLHNTQKFFIWPACESYYIDVGYAQRETARHSETERDRLVDLWDGWPYQMLPIAWRRVSMADVIKVEAPSAVIISLWSSAQARGLRWFHALRSVPLNSISRTQP